MGRNFIGHRGPYEDEWSWPEQETEAPRRRRPVAWWRRHVFSVLAAAVVALAAGLSLALFFALSSEESATPPSLDATPTGRPTPTVVPGVVATASPAPAGPRLGFYLWAAGRGQWQATDLQGEGSGYLEGQAVPFMLRIDDAVLGSVYRVTVSYDCRADGVAAFDFISGYERDLGDTPARAEPGPARSQPDAAISVPDDLSITFDDEARESRRLFRLWGGTFAAAPVGPRPEGLCTSDKTVLLELHAQAETVFLLWGGHLAAAKDWGPERGAASQVGPFGARVDVAATAPASTELKVLPGAISR